MITASRKHTIACGHRVSGHESKCAKLHGHNYTIHVTLEAPSVETGVDQLGRVVDFGVMKSVLFMWLEDNWDHKFLLWEGDPLMDAMGGLPGLVILPFNPTAENIAHHLRTETFPELLLKQNLSYLKVLDVTVDETPNCSASSTVDDDES